KHGAANEHAAVPEKLLVGNLAAIYFVSFFYQHLFTPNVTFDGSLNQRAAIIAHPSYYYLKRKSRDFFSLPPFDSFRFARSSSYNCFVVENTFWQSKQISM